MDLSVIQPPVQEDELEIHSSTLVNSLEIVPLDDSIEMPPPIDTQQILEFNQVISLSYSSHTVRQVCKNWKLLSFLV